MTELFWPSDEGRFEMFFATLKKPFTFCEVKDRSFRLAIRQCGFAKYLEVTYGLECVFRSKIVNFFQRSSLYKIFLSFWMFSL